MFFSCATLTNIRLIDKVAESYESAIKWSDFEKADSFISKQNPKKELILPDKKFLKKIQITSYELQNRKIHTEKSMVEQTVEIKYYNTDYLVEKVVEDNQIWIYESNSWQLSTGLPAFE
jgi:hypothetical protein